MGWQPDYASVADLRQYVRIDDAFDDTVLTLAISAASRAIDKHTGRQFGKVDTAEERRYTARLDRRRWRWVVDIDDLMDTDGLVVKVDGVTVTTPDLKPANAAKVGRPWEHLEFARGQHICGDEDAIAVTATWGWTDVPDAIRQATLLQASRLFSRRTSPYGVAGSPEMGSELRLLAKVDPDVEVAVADYVRDWGAI